MFTCRTFCLPIRTEILNETKLGVSVAVLAMIAIGMVAAAGETSVDHIGRKNFEALAVSCGMSPKLFLARLDVLASRIISVAEGLAKQLNSAWPSPVR